MSETTKQMLHPPFIAIAAVPETEQHWRVVYGLTASGEVFMGWPPKQFVGDWTWESISTENVRTVDTRSEKVGAA